MTGAQQAAHQRMMNTLPVRTHLRMGLEGDKHRIARPTSVSREAGRKGRVKAGLVIPEFRTLKQRRG